MDTYPDHSYVEPLTEREREVLNLLAAGASNKDIADTLVIEVSTVKWYNAQIYGKLAVSNRAQAVIRARTLGVLEADAATPPRTQHNLPADTLPFIGRAHEIQELAQQLTSETIRLITVLGPGGIGKTRLAIEVGRRLLGNFADGVYFVPLAPVTSEVHIITTLGGVIGFKFHGDIEPKTLLLEHLRKCQMLLIIDNFEHLLDYCDLLTVILHTSPNLKALVTSRELLNISGEQIYNVQGLPVPAENAQGEATAYDGVKLFVEAAQRRNTVIGHEATSTVARICRLLGGMPLGILLAAAWGDTLSVDEIEVELERGLGILEGALHDAPARHQSVEAVFDRSWARLNAQEQAVFGRLSVFRNGFTRDAARAVAGASLRDLQRLVHTSFLQHLPSGRYTIHELLRQYGGERLVESGKLQDARELHAEFFAELIRPLGETTFGLFTPEMLETIDNDYENVRAAWLFQAENRNTTQLRCFMDGLCMFYDSYNRNQEGVDLFEPLLAVFVGNSDDDTLLRGQLIARLVWFYSEMGLLNKSVELARQAEEILQAFDAAEDLMLLYFSLIQILGRMNRTEASIDYSAKFYALAQLKPDSKWRDLAYLWKQLDDMVGGRAVDALAGIEPLAENTWRTFFKAILLMHIGESVQAEALLLEGLNINWFSPIHYMYWYSQLIACATQTGDHDKAWRYVRGGLNYAHDGYYAWATFELFVAIIPLLIAEDQFASAAELVSLIIHHPSSTESVRTQAVTYKDMLEGKLPLNKFEAAWEQGKLFNLSDVITEYLER